MFCSLLSFEQTTERVCVTRRGAPAALSSNQTVQARKCTFE
jgi:hypothetical protein